MVYTIRTHKVDWDVIYMGKSIVVHEDGTLSVGLDSLL